MTLGFPPRRPRSAVDAGATTLLLLPLLLYLPSSTVLPFFLRSHHGGTVLSRRGFRVFENGDPVLHFRVCIVLLASCKLTKLKIVGCVKKISERGNLKILQNLHSFTSLLDTKIQEAFKATQFYF